MKKIFTLALLFASLFSFGQGIVLKHANTTLNNNDTIFVVPRFLNMDETVYIDIENTTTQELGIMVQRQVISLINNATTVFCIGDACLDADLSIFPEIIPAGGSLTHANDGDRSFHIFYNPNGSVGISLVKFTFFDQTTPSISKSVYIMLDNTISVSETTANNSLSAYPNPASNRVTIEHNLPSNPFGAQLIIRNMTGVIVYNSLIGNSTKTNITLENFVPGIYFYSIEVNNKSLLTKKLIIK